MAMKVVKREDNVYLNERSELRRSAAYAHGHYVLCAQVDDLLLDLLIWLSLQSFLERSNGCSCVELMKCGVLMHPLGVNVDVVADLGITKFALQADLNLILCSNTCRFD